jgi:outer membrane immunogenic protein
MTDAGFQWSGFYAGLHAGYIGGEARSVGAVTGVTTNVPVSGGLIGGTLGFNAQFDRIVLGLEGDLAWTGATGNATCAANPIYNCQGQLDWLGTFKGRAGFAFDRVLVFGTAGFAVGNTTANVTPAAPAQTNTFTGTMGGWTVGAGVEAFVSDAITVKAEYSYVSLSGLQAPNGTLSSAQASNLSATSHIVRLGVNYHF